MNVTKRVNSPNCKEGDAHAHETQSIAGGEQNESTAASNVVASDAGDGESPAEQHFVGVKRGGNARLSPLVSEIKSSSCTGNETQNCASRNTEPVTSVSTETESEALLPKMPQSVRDEALEMLKSPNLIEQIADDIEALGVAGERDLTKTIYLIGVSRLLDSPLAAIVQASSSSGKSYVVEKTTQLFPPETVIRATSISPKALKYVKPGSLSHRLIVAGERARLKGDDAAEATRVLREILSSGRYSGMVPLMNPNDEYKTKTFEQEGPIAYVETTSISEDCIFAEDANRCLLLSTDESEQQTKTILRQVGMAFEGAVNVDVNAIIQRHFALQRSLKRKHVVVPFARKLADQFDTRLIVARRAYPRLLAMIQAITLLYQYQRERDGQERIIAAREDYAIARELCRNPIARTLGRPASDKLLDFFDWLKRLGLPEFTTTDAKRFGRVSDRTVQIRLNDLAGLKAIAKVKASFGNTPTVWRILDVDRAMVANECFELPRVEEVCD